MLLIKIENVLHSIQITIKMPLSYATLKNEFESRNCRLITTNDEFINNKLHGKSYYNIIGVCTHQCRTTYENFKYLNVGLNCKECVQKRTTNILKNKESPTSNTEFLAFNILENILKNNFIIVKMDEGTTADFAIKPKIIKCNKFMPIQIKSSLKPNENLYNNYSFSLNKNYNNMLIILCCISDKKIWLFDSNDQMIRDKECISIGSKFSIFKKYEIDSKKLVNKLLEYYILYYHYTKLLEKINIPISLNQQNEQLFRKLRETKIPYLKYDYSKEEALAYDFKINNFKIQEKVASIINKKGRKIKDFSYYVSLTRGGRENGKNRKYLYKYDDNDFYWINTPDKEYFYIIPQGILLDHGLISPKNEKILGKIISIYPTICKESVIEKKIKYNWMNKYLFKYSEVLKETIIEIFKTGIVPELNPYRYSIDEYKDKSIIRTNSNSLGTKIQVLDKYGKLLNKFNSLTLAAKHYKCSNTTVKKYLNNGKIYDDKFWKKI